MTKIILIVALVLVGLLFFHKSQSANQFATFYGPQQWQGTQTP